MLNSEKHMERIIMAYARPWNLSKEFIGRTSFVMYVLGFRPASVQFTKKIDVRSTREVVTKSSKRRESKEQGDISVEGDEKVNDGTGEKRFDGEAANFGFRRGGARETVAASTSEEKRESKSSKYSIVPSCINVKSLRKGYSKWRFV